MLRFLSLPRLSPGSSSSDPLPFLHCTAQAWFANALARPSQASSCKSELAAIKAAYDDCSGLAPARTFEAFNAHARRVRAMGSWLDVLSVLKLGFKPRYNPRATFAAILRQAVLDSYQAGYHRAPAPLSYQQQKQRPDFIDWERENPIGVTGNAWT